jgi:hypothetical protein
MVVLSVRGRIERRSSSSLYITGGGRVSIETLREKGDRGTEWWY